MIGRAAMGNPWLIKEIIVGLDNKDNDESISLSERYHYIKKHFNSLIDLKGEYIATREMRTHIAAYISGLLKSKRIKDVINQLNTKEDMLELLDRYFTLIDSEKSQDSIENLVSEYMQKI